MTLVRIGHSLPTHPAGCWFWGKIVGKNFPGTVYRNRHEAECLSITSAPTNRIFLIYLVSETVFKFDDIALNGMSPPEPY